MGDKTRGLYQKFSVLRVDGKHLSGGKHFGCQYFVLDLTHDEYSIPAILEYANKCREKYPLLADDLMKIYKDKTGKW